MSEKILVAGSGIAGLGLALALAGPKREILFLDRDPPPPAASVDEAFHSWERKGATQLRHSHVFLGRLLALIRTRHPALYSTLLDEGARVLAMPESMPMRLAARYVPEPGDADLAFLFSRRTTLELVIRRYAATLPGVAFLTEAAARGIVTACEPGGGLRVAGLKVECGGRVEEMRADVTVDATGRTTNFPDWFAAAGARVEAEESPAGILYYTRHYRLKDGAGEPSRDPHPGAGDLGYIKYGVFLADNRHFSITLAVPEIEEELRMAVLKPEIFDAIVGAIPGARRWIESERAEPVTKVFAMGNLRSAWLHYVRDGEPIALGFFAVGDSAIRTNPLYGRGCSAAVIHAHALAETLDATRDARARALHFARSSRDTLRPFYDIMVRQDEQAIRRAKAECDPAHRPSLKGRIVRSFVEDAIGPASRGDLAVHRAVMRGFHMIAHPEAWLREPAMLARVLAWWAVPRFVKRARSMYPPPLGPARADMLKRLGLAI